MSGPWRPIKVCLIDVEHCPDEISAAPEYRALWALVRERGRPRGLLKLPFEDGRLTRAQIAAATAALPAAPPLPPLRRPADVSLPAISVVIPSLLERPEQLSACLASLSELDYPDYEVIVVDNRPTAAAPVELESARVVREPRRGISAARNRGSEVATGEIVVFTDDDAEADREWLLALGLRFRAHPEEDCVTGLIFPSELETPAQVAVEEYYGSVGPRTFEPVSHRLRVLPGAGRPLDEATVDALGDDGRCRRSFSLYAAGTFGPGANMAFRAPVLRRLGGFDLALGSGSRAGGGEDLEMFARMAWRGHSLGFEPAAIVRHCHRREDDALCRQIEGWGVGYGALLTALVLDDPRHLGRMLGTMRRAVRVVGGDYRRKLSAPASSPRTRELARVELRGMARGPVAYLRERWGRSG